MNNIFLRISDRVVFSLATIFLALSISSAALAQEGKIAVVDIPRAAMQTEFARKQMEEFRKQKTISEDIAELESGEAEYKKAREKLAKDRAIMSETKVNEAIMEIRSLEQDLQHTQKKLQEARQGVQQQIVQLFYGRALNITQNIVDEQAIELLLNVESGAVIHASAKYDITPQVTERLNQIELKESK